MSLINQMLQDLEQRQTANATRTTLGEIKAVPVKTPASPWWKISVIILLLLAAGLGWALYTTQTRTLATARTAPPQQAVKTLAQATPAAVNVAPPVILASATSLATPPTPGPADVQLKREVAIPVTASAAPPTPVPALSVESADRGRHAITPKAAVPTDSRPAAAVTAPAPVREETPSGADISKQVRQATPQQKAENEYRKASNLLSQGRIEEATDGYRNALLINPNHEAARQALLALLVENKKLPEAQLVLQETLQRDVNQPAYAMALARIDVEKGQIGQALEVLQATAPYAVSNAQYQAFMATLNQRQGKHREAVEYYQAALRLSPQTGVWWMGIGISLQALERSPEALEAFNRARSSGGLSPDLVAFVDQHLRQLQKTVR